MNRLVIIGNGFDIVHGLPTRYSDFMESLMSFEKESKHVKGDFIFLDSITANDQEKHLFLK